MFTAYRQFVDLSVGFMKWGLIRNLFRHIRHALLTASSPHQILNFVLGSRDDRRTTNTIMLPYHHHHHTFLHHFPYCSMHVWREEGGGRGGGERVMSTRHCNDEDPYFFVWLVLSSYKTVNAYCLLRLSWGACPPAWNPLATVESRKQISMIWGRCRVPSFELHVQALVCVWERVCRVVRCVSVCESEEERILHFPPSFILWIRSRLQSISGRSFVIWHGICHKTKTIRLLLTTTHQNLPMQLLWA